jgi:hypothetical protein
MIIQVFRFKFNISEWWFKLRLKWAINEANSRAKLLNKRFMVIVFAGRPMVYQKSHLKDLIRRRRFFKKGVTIAQLEKMAYYITP